MKKNKVVQTKNPKSNRYVKLDLEKGMVTTSKKSEGPYRNIPIIRKKKNNL